MVFTDPRRRCITQDRTRPLASSLRCLGSAGCPVPPVLRPPPRPARPKAGVQLPLRPCSFHRGVHSPVSSRSLRNLRAQFFLVPNKIPTPIEPQLIFPPFTYQGTAHRPSALAVMNKAAVRSHMQTFLLSDPSFQLIRAGMEECDPWITWGIARLCKRGQ